MKNIKKIAILAIAIATLNITGSFAQNYNIYQEKQPYLNTIPAYTPSNPVQADIQVLRIPAGEHLRLKLNKPINTHNHKRGEPFTATIIDDVRVNGNLLLPGGSIVRGRVGKVVESGYLSRSAELTLSIEHVVTPTGRDIPIRVGISSVENYIVDQDSIITTEGGYLNAVKKSLDTGIDTTIKTTEYGYKAGLWLGGNHKNHSIKDENAFEKVGIICLRTLPVVLITPIAAAGGTAIGSAVFFGGSVRAIVKKGNSIILDPTKLIDVTLVDPLDIPVN